MKTFPSPACFFALAVLAAGAAPAWSVTPVAQPLGRVITSYAATGTLAAISPARHTLTISGTGYRYTDALRIQAANGDSLTVQALIPGQSVAYTVDAGTKPGQPTVTELRLLARPDKER